MGHWVQTGLLTNGASVLVAHLKEAAVSHLVEPFFENSMESAVVALLDHKERKLTRDELDRLARLIEKAKKTGGRK